LNVDVRAVSLCDIQRLNCVEGERAHGQSAVCSSG
jgi:hypothetical protein